MADSDVEIVTEVNSAIFYYLMMLFGLFLIISMMHFIEKKAVYCL